MEPVPATFNKAYPSRGPLQQFRFNEATAFKCVRCGQSKRSKLITVYCGDWSRRVCNGCYGRLLSLYEIKAGTGPADERADKLAAALLAVVARDDERKSEQLFRAAEMRAGSISPEALRFIVTAEHVARHLETEPQLEWSPAVIGLCKALEAEAVGRILRPLAVIASRQDLAADRADKDLGRIAAFCADTNRKPPELGALAHFLQTVIHSQDRRRSSALIGSFLKLAGGWTGSHWILDPNGFHRTLTVATTEFRNRAAHIEELSKRDYAKCREFLIGPKGALWNLVVSTEAFR